MLSDILRLREQTLYQKLENLDFTYMNYLSKFPDFELSFDEDDAISSIKTIAKWIKKEIRRQFIKLQEKWYKVSQI